MNRQAMRPVWQVRRWLWLLAPLLLLAIWGQQRRAAKPTTGLRVVKVVDGDTVVLSDGRTVRYIGIDTPEHGQPYFDAARNFNRKLVLGKPVELEFDLERYDHYGRLLAYVFVRDEKGRRVFVNAEMVRNGFARTYTKPPNVRLVRSVARGSPQTSAGLVVGLSPDSPTCHRQPQHPHLPSA
jgi:micrococcal nuclease